MGEFHVLSQMAVGWFRRSKFSLPVHLSFRRGVLGGMVSGGLK